MKKAAQHNLAIAIASLLGCLALSACGEKAKAEEVYVDALSQALGVDVSGSMCTGGRMSVAITPQETKMASMSQIQVSPKKNSLQSSGLETSDGATPKAMSSMDHSHIPVAVPDNVTSPRLSATLTRDVMSGYNLKLDTQNYEMTAPPIGVPMENLMSPSVSVDTGFVQGHAHLYINGEKIQRVYGNNVHISATHFKVGMNQLNITINNHAHMFWTADDKKIISSLFINTSTPQLVMHKFDSFPVRENR